MTIARILKVNHGGEFGAIRIYRAQIWLARRLYPDVAKTLAEILENELRHCAAFWEIMQRRQIRPCDLVGLWGIGGFFLGILTALLGRQAIWICTSAVEHSVHRHMTGQIAFLQSRDTELCEVVRRIDHDEVQHLSTADERITSPAIVRTALHRVIFGITDVLIWLSLFGDSRRLQRELASGEQLS